ncbi:hypothetical protein K438DRAFT_176681, partial [Mycena galopus ATCC 62051]
SRQTPVTRTSKNFVLSPYAPSTPPFAAFFPLPLATPAPPLESAFFAFFPSAFLPVPLPPLLPPFAAFFPLPLATPAPPLESAFFAFFPSAFSPVPLPPLLALLLLPSKLSSGTMRSVNHRARKYTGGKSKSVEIL